MLLKSSAALIEGVDSFSTFFWLFLATLTGVVITQYPGISFRNSFSLILLPLHLVLGAVFALMFFPNLSIVFKFISLGAVGALLYIISLVNNIFVVVEDKSEKIPLYRVATTWSQILIVIISIPYFAGVFKINSAPLLQNLIIGFSAFLFVQYILWTFSFDNEIRTVGVGEAIMLGLFVSLLVLAIGFSVSFIPSESFLRSLLCSSVLMFGLNYLNSHLKNTLVKSTLLEYGFIFLFFLALVLIFKP